MLVVLLVISWTSAFFSPAHAQTPAPSDSVVVYIFWGDGCPHCAVAKPFLENIAAKDPRVILREYEVWYNEDNQKLFQQMGASFGFKPSAVPTIFIGNRHWEGYTDEIGQELQAAINDCLSSGCVDAGQAINPGAAATSQPGAEGAPTPQPASTAETAKVINVPLLGKINLEKQSLTVSTLLISFVDGVNPCSIWALSMLLALSLHTGSRKKVFLIGLVFLTVTAAVYAIFIAGLFTIFSVINFLGWIRAVVALLTLFFAVVNIKDYFWYKQGISFTIADEKKPGIFKRMRSVLDASQSFWGLVGATIVLAAGVSLVEFSCTAGFPVLWTNLLISQQVSTLTFILLLLLYMIIYQIDEMVIFGTAVFTLKSSKLEEKHGRILKLIGGMLMLALSLVMIFNPALMNNLGSSLLIFGASLLATGLVLLIHRSILPHFGIKIGSDQRRGGRKQARRRAGAR